MPRGAVHRRHRLPHPFSPAAHSHPAESPHSSLRPHSSQPSGFWTPGEYGLRRLPQGWPPMSQTGGTMRARGQAQGAWFNSLALLPHFRPSLLKEGSGWGGLAPAHTSAV